MTVGPAIGCRSDTNFLAAWPETDGAPAASCRKRYPLNARGSVATLAARPQTTALQKPRPPTTAHRERMGVIPHRSRAGPPGLLGELSLRQSEFRMWVLGVAGFGGVSARS
jgi:hypothetical protein